MSKIRLGFTSLFSFALLATVGCGEDPAKFADAPTVVVDAPPAIDAIQAGVVKVTVERAGGPAASVPVTFQNADDSVVSASPTSTDATGVASATMNPGGSVTVVLPALAGPSARPTEVFTFIGVKPGDELLVGRRTNLVSPSAASLKLALLPRGATVDVRTSCGGSFQGLASTSIALQIPTTCTSVDVFVSARNVNNIEIGTFFKGNVAVAAGTIDVAAEVLKVSKAHTFTLSNIPATTMNAQMSAEALAGALSVRVPETVSVNFPMPLGTTRSGDIMLPDIAGDVVLTTQMSRTISSIQVAVERAPLGPLTVDLTAAQIPWILSEPLFDAGGSQFAWTESSDGTAETVLANAQVSRAAVPPATQGEAWRHQVVAPHAVGQLRVPVLPVALSNFNVKSTDTVAASLALAKIPGGFDTIRAKAFVSDGIPTLLPTAGRVVLSQYLVRRAVN